MPAEIAIHSNRRGSLVDATVARIREVIELGKLEADDRLPGEQQWAAELGVSRPVLREAIGRLQSLGLVRVARGRNGGTFVASQDSLLACAQVVRSAVSISTKDVQQFAEFRQALEEFTARRTAEIATDQQLRELQEICDRLCTPDIDLPALLDADYKFHHCLAEIAGNQVILNTLQVSREIVYAIMRDSGYARFSDRGHEFIRRQHQPIVDAIAQRDPDAAATAMRVHMQRIQRDLKGG